MYRHYSGCFGPAQTPRQSYFRLSSIAQDRAKTAMPSKHCRPTQCIWGRLGRAIKARSRRGARDGENLPYATCPLLLQASMKLYGIDGHVVLLFSFVFECWTWLGSSPSASAQYISASF